MRLGRDLRIAVFRELRRNVTPLALRSALPQYLKVTQQQMKPCTGTFTRSTGWPCFHKTGNRLNDVGGGAIKIEDVHLHWRFEKPARPPPSPPANLPPPTSLLPANPPPPSAPQLSAESDTSEEERVEVEGYLGVNKLAVVKLKGRLAGALYEKRDKKSPKMGKPNWSQAFEEKHQ